MEKNEMDVLMNEEVSDAQDYLQMGQVLLGSNKYEEALKMFEKALTYDPMNKITYISKGIAHASKEDYANAKECFKRAIKIDKKFADAYFQLGNIAFLEDDIQGGMQNYNEAIAYGYKDASLYYNLALVHEEQGNAEEAIRYYTKAANMDGTTPEYLLRKASLQLLSSKYEEALQTLEKVRSSFPESFEGYHLTAAAYTMMEKYDEADKLLESALLMFPDDKDIMLDRLKVLSAKGDADAALTLIEDIKLSGCTQEELKAVLLNEAKVQGQKDSLDKTISTLEEALKIEDGDYLDSEIKYLLLNAYFIKRDYVNMYKVAQKMDKNDTSDPYNLSGMYFECIALKGQNSPETEKHLQKAVRYYRNISVKEPSRVDAFLFRAMCYRELKDYEKAVEAVDYVLLLQPENAQLHQIKGNLLKDQGKEAEAKVEFTEAKRLGLSQNYLDLLGGM